MFGIGINDKLSIKDVVQLSTQQIDFKIEMATKVDEAMKSMTEGQKQSFASSILHIFG